MCVRRQAASNAFADQRLRANYRQIHPNVDDIRKIKQAGRRVAPGSVKEAQYYISTWELGAANMRSLFDYDATDRVRGTSPTTFGNAARGKQKFRRHNHDDVSGMFKTAPRPSTRTSAGA